MNNFTKIVNIGQQMEHGSRGMQVAAPVFCKIKYEDKKLSITGVVGPKRNGNSLGYAGQIYDSIDIESFYAGWDKKKLERFIAIWCEWHLNDLCAYTPDMKAQGWDKLASKEIFKYSYIITTDNHKRLNDIKKRCEYAALHNEVSTLPEEEKRLLRSETHAEIYAYELPETPEFMEPWTDIKNGKHKIERKTLGWVDVQDHEDGLLGRELNGNKYGHEWYFHEVPQEVLKFLSELPETEVSPNWI